MDEKAVRMRTRTWATGSSFQCRRCEAEYFIAGRAFTLIEVIVVIVLLGLSASLIVPRMGRSLGHSEFREAVARFAQTATVRELAVARQQLFVITIDLDRGAYEVIMQSKKERGMMQRVQTSWLKPARWPETVEVRQYRTPDGVSVTRDTQELKFYKDGTSSGASIVFACDTDEYVVVVHPHNGQVIYGDTEISRIAPVQYDLGD